MVDQPAKSIHDLVRHLGRYPEDAFLFVREGLSYTAEMLHGPETDSHRRLQEFMSSRSLDWAELVEQYDAGQLPEEIEEAIDSAGGCEKINRHVSGRQLCWGLRDYALQRWGLLARTVLESWRVKGTRDFGKIVFGFIDFDLMRKRPEDAVEDFDEVYSFTEAFDEPFSLEADSESDSSEDSGEPD